MQSMSAMRKMQLVQPKVAALQKKYKGEPQKLNAEMVDLYKKEGVNPLGGCLPFLLQMPVFMALYQILWRAYYFQGQSFLWMKDLAMPDRLFIMPFDLPFLGNEFNILPIIMGAVMFLQQSVSAKNMVVTDDQQAMQQKMIDRGAVPDARGPQEWSRFVHEELVKWAQVAKRANIQAQ